MNKELIDFSQLLGEEAEFIPLITNEEDLDIDLHGELPKLLPILPLRGNVFFPGIVIPISAGREKSIKLIKEAYRKKLIIGVVAQSNDSDDPGFDDVYKIGTYARVLKTLNMPDGTTMVIIQGIDRFELKKLRENENYWEGETEIL